MYLFSLTVLLTVIITGETLCPEPEPVPNVYRNWDGKQHNSTVTYRCYYGYTLQRGNLSRHCDNASYTGLSPECSLDCGVPRTIYGSEMSYTKTSVGHQVVYTCWENYTQCDDDENMISYCNPFTQRWSTASARCKSRVPLLTESNCTYSNGEPNAPIQFDISEGDVFYQVTDISFSWCHEMSILPEDIIITVRKSRGSWSIPNCAFLEQFDMNTNDSMIYVNCSGIAIGQSVAFLPRFTNSTNNDSSLCICNINIYGRLHEIDCGRPDFVHGSKVEYTDSSFRSSAHFKCEDGFYSLNKYSVARCLFFNKWSFGEIRCTSEPNIAANKFPTNAKKEQIKILTDNEDETCTEIESGWLTIDFGQEAFEFREVVIRSREESYWNRMSVLVESVGGRRHRCTDNNNRHFYKYILNTFKCLTYPVGSKLLIKVNSNINLCEIRAFGVPAKGSAVFGCLRSARGQEYRGFQARTNSGKVCEAWQILHNMRYRDIEVFPDETLADAGNFCRNPGGIRLRPWCFTRKDGKTWEYCPIINCTNVCSLREDGFDYTGNIDKTKNGHVCQKWSSITDTKMQFAKSVFPDFEDDHNFCRNPGNSQSAPWCFTNSTSLEYDHCHIPECPKYPFGASLEYKEDENVIPEIFVNCFIWTSNHPRWQYRIPGFKLSNYFISKVCDQWNNNITLLCSKSGVRGLHWMYVYINCLDEKTTFKTEVVSTSISTYTYSPTPDEEYTTELVEVAVTSPIMNKTDPCSCYSIPSNADIVQIMKERIVNITIELTVRKESLSSTIRKRVSAEDDRPSVSYLGCVAMTILLLIVSIIIIPDILQLFWYIKLNYLDENPSKIDNDYL